MVKSSKILVWTLSIIGFLLTIIEIRYIGNSYVYIVTIITSIAIFRLSFMYDIEEGNNFYYKLGRNYSTMIFIVHCAVIKILNQINFTNENEVIRIISIIGLSILIAMICVKISEKCKKNGV